MGYKGGYTEARRWNREAYNQYQTDRAESRTRFNENVTEAEALRQRTLADYDKLSDQDKVDWRRSQEASMAAQNQALAARGLSGSSIANNAYAGNSRETAYGLNRIADERQRGRIGYDVGLTADLINLKQAGPTSPSTAMYQATVQNLQASMQYKLAQEAAAYARQGPNKSWSTWLSGFTAPGNVESMAWDALSFVAQTSTGTPYEHTNSDPYYGGGSGGGNGYGNSGRGGEFGSQTSAMTQGQPSQSNYGRATQQATGGRGGGPTQSGASAGQETEYVPPAGFAGTGIFAY